MKLESMSKGSNENLSCGPDDHTGVPTESRSGSAFATAPTGLEYHSGETPDMDSSSSQYATGISASGMSTSTGRQRSGGEAVAATRYLEAILSVGNLPPCEPQLVDLPQVDEAISTDRVIPEIMEEIVQHYDAAQCLFTWRDSGEVLVMAVPAKEVSRFSPRQGTQLFNHSRFRELPIIINDAEDLVVYARESLPHYMSNPGFYCAVPLVVAKTFYVGTLCIVGSASNPDFKLKDADYLVEKGVELTTALQNCIHLSAQIGDLESGH
jgi:hypothetical protein